MVYRGPAASIILQEAVNEAMSVVPESMKYVCTVWDVDVRDLLETHEEVAGALLRGRLISS